MSTNINAAFVRFAKQLGREDDSVVKRCKEQLMKYDPVHLYREAGAEIDGACPYKSGLPKVSVWD